MIALFARPNHPTGFGMGNGTAHGYVMISVDVANYEQLELVKERLRRPFYGIRFAQQYDAGYLGAWFGGTFDFLAAIPTEQPVLIPSYDPTKGVRARTLGDNRFFGHFVAEDVLEA